MPLSYDVAAVGNAIVDVIAPASDAFLAEEKLDKGAMMLIDTARADSLYKRMAAGIEASGGSAGNTVAGVASLGGKAAYIGKVAKDTLGEVFRHDITAIGVHFDPTPMVGEEGTGRCLINVTDDAQRTMCTYLGAANALTPDDVDPALIEAAGIVYLEGYLFDPPAAREAFAKAARIARKAGRRVALTLSDAFVVHRHRDALLDFIAGDMDIVFANEVEVCAMFETEDFGAALKALSAKVETAVVTRGAAGSTLISKGERADVAAEPVAKVIDTTGAGDQYAAGVLFGLARGLTLAQSGRLGAIAAAEVISHYGPRPQTPLKGLAEAAGLI
ncbi:adenosine kinase [Caulobacter sp. S45]|uniref:adenosine kinase n=1 Tax=Caulobacter sp. S45 TaxID=1641861 RepID=UPI00131B59D0|nr:adenosine kinase [Caulobacter sp. S45]